MCCLFGILDYKRSLSLKDRRKMLRVLSTECEERGTDATGIAYFTGNRLTIHKAPKPAHKMKYQLAAQARYIMGHTRMATQGSEKQNYNNHPFSGKAGRISFALAHNGVLYNDRELRREKHLPTSKVETDSYIAVQLLEQAGEVSFSSLRQMAEAVQGSFTFTVLDASNNLYIVKGNNPLCIYQFEGAGLYLYASTQEILQRAVDKLHLNHLHHKELFLRQGDILCIKADGETELSCFNDSHLWRQSRYSWDWDDYFPAYGKTKPDTNAEDAYMDELADFAAFHGIERDTLETLADAGYDWMDLEEMLYDPELLHECLKEFQCGSWG